MFKNIKETDNFIIKYNDSDEQYIESIIKKLNNESKVILAFFDLIKTKDKVTIIIYDNIDEYKNNLIPYLKKENREYQDWMMANTYDGNVNLQSLNMLENYDISSYLACALHEYVHICHKCLNENMGGWFAEALATNLGNPNEFKQIDEKIDITIEELRDKFDEIPNAYRKAFHLGRYIIKNYTHEEVLKIIKNKDYMLEKTNNIIEEYNASINLL